MRRHARIVVMLLAILPSQFAQCFAAENEERDNVLRCGVIATLTGGHAPIGSAIKNSIVLASEEGSAPGVHFLFEDDAFLPRNTVLAANKLMGSDRVECLIVFGSSTSLAIADLAERAAVPMISIAVSPKMTEGRKYVFRLYIPISRQKEAIAAEVRKRAYHRVAFITTIQDATLSLKEQVLQELKGTVVFDEEIVPEDAELKSIALRIKAKNPDAVFLNLLPPQISNLSRQLRAIGYKGDFFGGPPLGNLDEARAAGDALNDAWFVSVDDLQAGSYYENYRKRFGEHPAVEGIYGYEIARVLSQANIKNAELVNYLANLSDFSGTLGRYSVRENSFDIPAGLWRIRDGKLLGPSTNQS